MPEHVDQQPCWTEDEAAAIRAGLERVLQGASLRQAPRQQRLLRRIVVESLEGYGERLKGYTLGVEVFDRGVDFDPGVDPIVRVEAGRLRSKLLEHYASDGAGDPVRIEVPKGGYAARFSFRESGPEMRGAQVTVAGGGPAGGRTGINQRIGEVPAGTETMFGRDDDIATIHRLLGAHRMVTVLGAGGIGKTRLAEAATDGFLARPGFRVAWVDLSRIADSRLLPTTLAQALQLPIVQQGDAISGLLAALRPLAVLVVLDNAEHLVEAVADLVRLAIDAAPGLRVLVTSQAPLQIAGERIHRLEGLEVPAPSATPQVASRASAVALFVERVHATGHPFELNEGNVAAVVRLCRRLDGLPLAIRLAAARVPLLGLGGIESRLHERLQLLTGASRDAPSRQHTLTAALQWSVGLLPPGDQALFRQLGVFVGGFTLDLAVRACCDDDVGEWAVIDGLGRLLERSLLSLEPKGPLRYRLLEGPREYALRLLCEEGEALQTARRRHAQAVADWFFVADKAVWTMRDCEWVPRWAPDLDNVRAALDWSAKHDATLFVSLVGSTAELFRLLDLNAELRRRTAAIGVQAVEGVDDSLLARYWLELSITHINHSSEAANEFALRAERHARVCDDTLLVYLALCHQVQCLGEPTSETQAVLKEMAELESAKWPARVRASGLLAQSRAQNVSGRFGQALQAAELGLAIAIEADCVLQVAVFGTFIVSALMGQGAIEAALKRSIEIRTRLTSGTAPTMILFEGTCARAALALNDLETARQGFQRMFEAYRTVEWAGFERFAASYVELAISEKRFGTAGYLLGFALSATPQAFDGAARMRQRDQAHAVLAARIESSRLAGLIAEGKELDPESICALVLGGPPTSGQPEESSGRRVVVPRNERTNWLS